MWHLGQYILQFTKKKKKLFDRMFNPSQFASLSFAISKKINVAFSPHKIQFPSSKISLSVFFSTLHPCCVSQQLLSWPAVMGLINKTVLWNGSTAERFSVDRDMYKYISWMQHGYNMDDCLYEQRGREPLHVELSIWVGSKRRTVRRNILILNSVSLKAA